MSNIVRELDQSRAYVDCPTCEKSGVPNSPLTREMHIFKCPLGHTFTAFQVISMNPHMTKMNEIVIEQPHPLSVKKFIYVLPNVWTRIEERYKGRLNATLSTVFDALSDSSIIFIAADYAKKLNEMGYDNAPKIVAALESAAQLEKDRQDAIDRLEKLENMIRALQNEEE